MPVTVTALRSFNHEGRTVQAGDLVDVERPIDAAILARKGLVSLSRIYRNKVMEPEPEPDLEPVRVRRRYKRRDMRAETE